MFFRLSDIPRQWLGLPPLIQSLQKVRTIGRRSTARPACAATQAFDLRGVGIGKGEEVQSRIVFSPVRRMDNPTNTSLGGKLRAFLGFRIGFVVVGHRQNHNGKLPDREV